jgi:hypothetical protein
MASDAANDRAVEQFGPRLITTDSFTLRKARILIPWSCERAAMDTVNW